MASFAKEYLELITALQGLRVSGYVDTGSFALLVYDYMLTFEDERTFIWPSKWSIPKILFLMTRYLPLIDLSITASHHFRTNMTPEACALAYKSAGWLINIGIITAEFILVIRTWAIWGHNRLIGILLIIWAAANVIPDLVVMILFIRSIGFTQLPSGLSGCLVTSGNTLIVGVWILLMIYEAGIIFLMVIKGIQMYKEQGSSALYLAVFKNGAIFYVYIFALSVANVIVISRLSRDLSTMLASIERVTHAILTGRLLLTLKKTFKEPGSYELEKLTDIQFDDGPQGTVDTENAIGTFGSSLVSGQGEDAGPLTSTVFSAAKSSQSK